MLIRPLMLLAAAALALTGLAVPAAAQPAEIPVVTFRERCDAVVVQVQVAPGTGYTIKLGKKGGHQLTVGLGPDFNYPVVVEQGETVEVTIIDRRPVILQVEHVRQTPVTCVTAYVDVSGHPQCQDNSMIVELKNRLGQTSGFTLFRNDKVIAKDVVLPTYERRFFILTGLSADEKIYVKYGPDLEPYGTLVRGPARHCEHVSSTVTFADSCDGVQINISPAKHSMYARVYDSRNYDRGFETRGDQTNVPAEPGQLVAVFDLIDSGGEQQPEIIPEVAAHVHARPANCSGGGGAPGGLPVTGQRTPLFVGAGVALLGAGVVALLFGRRRRAPR